MRFFKARQQPLAPPFDAPDAGRRAALIAGAGALLVTPAQGTTGQPTTPSVPVLVYHRFASQARDSMTVRTTRLREHIDVIRSEGCTVVSLHDVVAWHRGETVHLPPRPVALSIDDGHRSVADEAASWLMPTGWPVTLFIYPSAISNASYAMEWEALRQLQTASQGRWRIESHTYWHPHLGRERRSRTPADFERFATDQLQRSRSVLSARTGRDVRLLAWPFGVSDAGIQDLAAQCGYRAAFGLGGRACTRSDPVMDLPRHLVVDGVSGRQLAGWLHPSTPPSSSST